VRRIQFGDQDVGTHCGNWVFASHAKKLAERQPRCVQLEGLIAKGVAEAREQIRAQRRERALLSLRKNKVYEHSLDGIDAYLLNVEQVAHPADPSFLTSFCPQTNRFWTELSSEWLAHRPVLWRRFRCCISWSVGALRLTIHLGNRRVALPK